MLALISRGVSLGFTAGVLPGPMQSYIIGTTLTGGWRRGLVIIFSPLVIDIPIIILVVFVLGQLPAGFIRVIQVIGGVFLLWIARETWLTLRAGAQINADRPAETTNRGIFARAMLLNALSPGPYLFWSTVNGPLLIQALEQSVLHGVAFLAAFYGAFLTIMALTVALFDRVRSLDARFTQVILLLTLVILVVFGLSLILGVAL
jgi:threonine/homoserine/homoserine lactone efflux protein